MQTIASLLLFDDYRDLGVLGCLVPLLLFDFQLCQPIQAFKETGGEKKDGSIDILDSSPFNDYAI